jgi:transcriptional regulator with XRE-family HTH domain
MKEFAEKLKALRNLHYMTQQEVAEKIGVTRSAYSNYEQGLRTPDLEVVKKICLLYEISADFLLGIDEI